jgi:hypothetical protein
MKHLLEDIQDGHQTLVWWDSNTYRATPDANIGGSWRLGPSLVRGFGTRSEYAFYRPLLTVSTRPVRLEA